VATWNALSDHIRTVATWNALSDHIRTVATWNALPDHIRTVVDPVKFRKLLKSHFLVKLLTFVDFCVFLGVLILG